MNRRNFITATTVALPMISLLSDTKTTDTSSKNSLKVYPLSILFINQSFLEDGKILASQIKNGNFPIEGTTEKDYMIIGDFAVYTPYIPLYTTQLPEKKQYE